MNFMVTVVLMWALLAMTTRKPVKFWLPFNVIAALFFLKSLHSWTDLPGKGNWSDGLFVGGITGAAFLPILAYPRSKKIEAGSGDESSPST